MNAINKIIAFLFRTAGLFLLGYGTVNLIGNDDSTQLIACIPFILFAIYYEIKKED